MLQKTTVDAYTSLLARAFGGAITVNGQRIVAHPSGTLLVRTDPQTTEQHRLAWQQLNALGPGVLDRNNDWSDV
jgi:hypothetical protein